MNPEQQPSPQTPPVQPSGWTPLPDSGTSQPQPTPVAPSTFNTQSASPMGENYLDQIAIPEPVHVHKFAMIGLIGGVLVLLVVILAIMMNSGGPSLSVQAKSVNDRVNTLKTIASNQQKHLSDNAIVTNNTILSSVLTTMSTELTDTMKTRKITLSSTASAAEKKYATTLTTKLDDAYQRGTLDRTYAPQITYELSILRSKLVTMKASSNSTAITTYCTSSIASLDAIIKTFKDYSSTN